VVTAEMHRLDHNADTAFESVNALFAEVNLLGNLVMSPQRAM
jgi:hypothetical protein